MIRAHQIIDIELTPEERIALYEAAIKVIEKYHFNGICFALSEAAQELLGVNQFTSGAMSYQEMEKYYPEVAKYKPADKIFGERWWPEYHRVVRVRVLQAAIKDVVTVPTNAIAQKI